MKFNERAIKIIQEEGPDILKAIDQTISHYTRMLDAIEDEPSTDPASRAKMYNMCGENWYGEHCPLCQHVGRNSENRLACSKCILVLAGHGCANPFSYWHWIAHSSDWGEWRTKVRDFITFLQCKLRPEVVKHLSTKHDLDINFCDRLLSQIEKAEKEIQGVRLAILFQKAKAAVQEKSTIK